MDKTSKVTALNGDYWKPIDTQHKRRRLQRTIFTEDDDQTVSNIPSSTLENKTTTVVIPNIVSHTERQHTTIVEKALSDDPSTIDSSPPILAPDSPSLSPVASEKVKRIRKSPTLGKAYYRPNKAEQLSSISEIQAPSLDTTSLPSVASSTTEEVAKEQEKKPKKKKRKTTDTPSETKHEKKQSKKPKAHRVHGLRLDDALAHTDNMEGWSEARKKAFAMIHSNPNMYYYRFNAPGEAQKNGHWTQEEKQLFFKRMNELGGIDYKWGIFSMSIPGRVGYQCANFYRKLIKDGEVKDSNYSLDDKGEPVYMKSGKDSATSSTPTTPKKKKEKKEPKEKRVKKEIKEPKEKKTKKKKPAAASTQEIPKEVSQDLLTAQAKTEPISPKKLKQTTIMESMNMKKSKPTTAKSTAAKARKLLKKKQAAEQRKLAKKKEAEDKKMKDVEDKKRRQEELERFYEDDVKGKEVLPRLFIGNKRVAQNKEWLESNNVRFILNISREVANFYESEITYKRVGIADSMEENAKQHFEEATSFIRDGLTAETAVLVHCAEGKSRSATFTLAYLLKWEQWDLKKAFEHLSSVSNININDGFKQQLMDFEKLLGRDVPLYNFFTGRRSPLRTSREVPNTSAKKTLTSSANSTPQIIELNAQSGVPMPLDTISDQLTKEPLEAIKETKEEPVTSSSSANPIEPLVSVPIVSSLGQASKPVTAVKPPTQIIEALRPTAVPKPHSNPESEEQSSDPMFWGSTGENSNNTSLDSLGTDEKVLDDWLSIVIQ